MLMTYLGTATLLIEIGSVRILTDPVLNQEPGWRYHAGFGIFYHSELAQTRLLEGLGRVDAVLLSHDQHGDNLDEAGRAFLPDAKTVVTTRAAARRLRNNAHGLVPFETTTVRGQDGFELRVTAMPARHGPPLSRPLVGAVIGFMLEWQGQKGGAIYISGDTVYYRGIEEIARRYDVGTAILHVGAATFPILGHLTFTANEAARATRALNATRVVPVHFEGWSHFRDARDVTEDAFRRSGLSERLVWLERGKPTQLF